METLINTLDVAGKVLVGFTALMVHHRFLKEHKVDNKVFKSMRREQLLGILGIVMIIIAYILDISLKT